MKRLGIFRRPLDIPPGTFPSTYESDLSYAYQEWWMYEDRYSYASTICSFWRNS